MYGILFLLLGGAAVTDLWNGSISNLLLFPAAMAGILLRLEAGGMGAVPGLTVSVLLPLGLVPFWLCGRGIAAGDIKLFLTISLLLEPKEFLLCFFLSFLAGAALSLIVLLKTHDLHAPLPMAVPAAAGTMIGICARDLARTAGG